MAGSLSHLNLLSSAKICSVNKMRDSEPQLFKEICMMHLSRTMDLAGYEFMDLFDSVANNKQQTPVKRKSKRIKMAEQGVMNGAPLTQEGICRIYQLVEFIAQDFNLCQKEIFRRPGNQGRQFQLKLLLNKGSTLDLDSNTYSVHDCCSVLKGFLSDMPQPLLCPTFFQTYLRITDGTFTDQNAQSKQIKCLRILFLLLPLENFILLHNLLSLLKKVTNQEDVNGMCAEYLAIMFVPIILCPRELTAQQLRDNLRKAVPAMRFMIEHGPELFDVPAELLADIVMHLKGLDSGLLQRGGAVQSSIMFCQQTQTPNNGGKTYTQRQMEELYADVQMMPDCDQKRIFMKRFQQQNNHLTPVQRVRTRSVGNSIKKLRLKLRTSSGSEHKF